MLKILLVLFVQSLYSFSLFPIVPQLYTPSKDHQGRLSTMNLILRETDFVFPFYYLSKKNYFEMTTRRSIFKSPIADQQTLFGPSTHITVGSLIDLCQHAKPFLNTSFSTIWKSGKFCDIVFCQNSTISFNETDLDYSVFSVCFHFLLIFSIVTFVKKVWLKPCLNFQIFLTIDSLRKLKIRLANLPIKGWRNFLNVGILWSIQIFSLILRICVIQFQRIDTFLRMISSIYS
jgi:hypothetical protein